MSSILRSSLYSHQKENVQFHLQHKASADWSEPGTGKSLISLAKLAILMDLGIVTRALIICPKTVMLTWDIEIRKHTTLRHTPLLGSLNIKIRKLSESSHIFSLTYDSLPGKDTTRGKLFKAILEKRFDFLIGDEVTLIQNREALRTKALTILGDSIPNKIFLSGTPITNNPTAIFNIYRALDGGKTFGSNFYAWRNTYFKNVGSFYSIWVPKNLKLSQLTEKIYKTAIRRTKEECLDLPEKVWSTRYMELSNEQLAYYIPIAEGILKDFTTLSGKVKVTSILDKIFKLSQIIGGFIYTKEKGAFIFKDNPRISLLQEVIDEFPKDEKIIIYCKWREEIEILKKWCEEQDYSYVVLTGSVKDKERAQVVHTFQNGDVKLLLCNIAVGKFSLTLTASATIIYYSMGFSIEEFIQSSDRIHRISQNRTCIYIPLLVEGGMDEYIYESVNKKIKMASAITDPAFREHVQKIIERNT